MQVSVTSFVWKIQEMVSWGGWGNNERYSQVNWELRFQNLFIHALNEKKRVLIKVDLN